LNIKMKVKDMMGIMISVPILGATLGAIGSTMTGGVAGIGRATQTMVAGGYLGHVAGKVKNTFKL